MDCCEIKKKMSIKRHYDVIDSQRKKNTSVTVSETVNELLFFNIHQKPKCFTDSGLIVHNNLRLINKNHSIKLDYAAISNTSGYTINDFDDVDENKHIYICETCFTLCKTVFEFGCHLQCCANLIFTMGNTFYINDSIHVIQLSAGYMNSQQFYLCQNIAKFFQLFVSTKTNLEKVEQYEVFLAYTRNNNNLIGYFSKDRAVENYHPLSTIAILPPFAQSGVSQLLLSMSLVLSEQDNMFGKVERPLSVPGKKLIYGYYGFMVLYYFYQHRNLSPSSQIFNMDHMSKYTQLTKYDIFDALFSLELLVFSKDQIFILYYVNDTDETPHDASYLTVCNPSSFVSKLTPSFNDLAEYTDVVKPVTASAAEHQSKYQYNHHEISTSSTNPQRKMLRSGDSTAAIIVDESPELNTIFHMKPGLTLTIPYNLRSTFLHSLVKKNYPKNAQKQFLRKYGKQKDDSYISFEFKIADTADVKLIRFLQ